MSDFRKAMPNVAQAVDSFKSAFGDDVKVIVASEGDVVVETKVKKEEPAMYEMSAAEFLEVGRICREAEALVNRPKGRKRK